MERTYLTDQQVADRYGVSRYTIWRWHREKPDFPRARKIAAGTTRWVAAEIADWDKAQTEIAA